MIHDESAEVGDKNPTAIGINAYHAIGDIRHAMRAASSGEHGIKRVSDESDIGDAADKIASVCTRLAGRQIVHYRRAETVRTDFRNARASNVGCVRTNRWDDLVASAIARIQAASSSLCDIKKAVWAKLQAARIVQSGGKDRDVGRSG